jgi:hypothetical protein
MADVKAKPARISLSVEADRVRRWQLPEGGRQVVRVLSLVVLGIAIIILIWGMWSAVVYTLTHTGPACSNPPQLEANPPQWIMVASCLAAFVLGHLTARWQFVDEKKKGHHALVPDGVRRKQALIIQALLLAFLLEVIGLLVIEAVTLSNGVWPITYYIRCAYNAAGVQTLMAAAAILFLVGRWFWLPARVNHARTRP